MPLKRGGQPGNLNALRQGFYSRQLRQQELEGIDLVELSDLTGEVSVLRACIRRLLELSERATDLDSAMNLPNLLGSSCICVSNIIYRFKSMTGGQDQEITQALSDALDRAAKEMKPSGKCCTSHHRRPGHASLVDGRTPPPPLAGICGRGLLIFRLPKSDNGHVIASPAQPISIPHRPWAGPG